MRHFDPIPEDGTCDICRKPVQRQEKRSFTAATGEYSSATVVRYDGSELRFTYCSNRCLNGDAERSSRAARQDTVSQVGCSVIVTGGEHKGKRGETIADKGHGSVTVRLTRGSLSPILRTVKINDLDWTSL